MGDETCKFAFPYRFSCSSVAAVLVVVPESGERGGGVAAQLVEAEEVREMIVQEGVPVIYYIKGDRSGR